MRYALAFLLAAVIVVVFLFATPARAQREMPFAPGEKLTYVLKWEAIPAGQASLEVMPMSPVPGQDMGQKAWRFHMSARTNAFVDIFFKVRDEIDAWVDETMDHSLLFRQQQREGSYHRDVQVDFDWNALKATYSNKGERRDPITIFPGTYDVLSVFYYFRMLDVFQGARLSASVTDGKKNVLGYADVLRREWVTTPAGEFDTWLVQPDLQHLGGVFRKSPEAKLLVWVTADGRNIPVRIKSKVVVGSFYVELVEQRL